MNRGRSSPSGSGQGRKGGAFALLSLTTATRRSKKYCFGMPLQIHLRLSKTAIVQAVGIAVGTSTQRVSQTPLGHLDGYLLLVSYRIWNARSSIVGSRLGIISEDILLNSGCTEDQPSSSSNVRHCINLDLASYAGSVVRVHLYSVVPLASSFSIVRLRFCKQTRCIYIEAKQCRRNKCRCSASWKRAARISMSFLFRRSA